MKNIRIIHADFTVSDRLYSQKLRDLNPLTPWSTRFFGHYITCHSSDFFLQILSNEQHFDKQILVIHFPDMENYAVQIDAWVKKSGQRLVIMYTESRANWNVCNKPPSFIARADWQVYYAFIPLDDLTGFSRPIAWLAQAEQTSGLYLLDLCSPFNNWRKKWGETILGFPSSKYSDTEQGFHSYFSDFLHRMVTHTLDSENIRSFDMEQLWERANELWLMAGLAHQWPYPLQRIMNLLNSIEAKIESLRNQLVCEVTEVLAVPLDNVEKTGITENSTCQFDILIVDDQPNQYEEIKNVIESSFNITSEPELKKLGTLKFHYAQHAEQALELHRQYNIQLIIMDCIWQNVNFPLENLKDENGDPAKQLTHSIRDHQGEYICRFLRDCGIKTSIVLCTAERNSLDGEKKAKKVGACKHLFKKSIMETPEEILKTIVNINAIPDLLDELIAISCYETTHPGKKNEISQKSSFAIALKSERFTTEESCRFFKALYHNAPYPITIGLLCEICKMVGMELSFDKNITDNQNTKVILPSSPGMLCIYYLQQFYFSLEHSNPKLSLTDKHLQIEFSLQTKKHRKRFQFGIIGGGGDTTEKFRRLITCSKEYILKQYPDQKLKISKWLPEPLKKTENHSTPVYKPLKYIIDKKNHILKIDLAKITK